MDAMTLDIVAMLFDEIFDDDKIPVAMKGMIGRLQIPTLKVAILDKTFFSRRDHPARLLLDSLGEIGLGLPPEFDDESPLYKQIESLLQKLIDGFREDIGIFDELRTELESLIAEQNRRAEEESARLAKAIEEKERLSVARVAAQNEIRQRVQSTKLPRSVLKFLTEQWVKLLLVAHAKNGPDGDLWKAACATMDVLIWSVNPSKSLEERRQLASKLPALLKRLNAGMQLIRQLVYAFYSPEFSFGRFNREYPHHHDHVVRLLIGDVFNGEVDDVFEAMRGLVELPAPYRLEGSVAIA
jgi:hypothetical protein